MLLALQCVYGCSDERSENGMGRMKVRFVEKGREWILPYLLYADDLILCAKYEKYLKVMV